MSQAVIEDRYYLGSGKENIGETKPLSPSTVFKDRVGEKSEG